MEIEDDKETVAAARAQPSRVEEVIDKEKIVQSQTRSSKNDLPTSMTTNLPTLSNTHSDMQRMQHTHHQPARM